MCDPEGQNLDVRHSEGQYRRDGRYPTGHYQREIPKREIIKMDNTKTSATQLDVNPDMPPPDGRYSEEQYRRDGRYPTGHYQREIPKREIIKMDNTKTSATQLDVNPDMRPPDGRYSAESHYYGSNVYQNSQRYNDFENIDIRAPLVSI